MTTEKTFNPSKRQLAKAFRAAAKLILANGKVVGDFSDGKGRYCMIGAVQASIGIEPGRLVAASPKGGSNFFAKHLGFDGGITAWEFSDKNSESDIAKRLREYAYRLEHGGKKRPPKRRKPKELTFAEKYPNAAITELQATEWLKLIELVEEKGKVGAFDWSVFRSDYPVSDANTCGTVACVCGWAEVTPYYNSVVKVLKDRPGHNAAVNMAKAYGFGPQQMGAVVFGHELRHRTMYHESLDYVGVDDNSDDNTEALSRMRFVLKQALEEGLVY